MNQFASQSDQSRSELDAAQTQAAPADHQQRKHRGLSLSAKRLPLDIHASPHVQAARDVQQQATRSPRVIAQAKRTALARKPVMQRSANGYAMPLSASLANFNTSAGRVLPDPVREKMESFFGTSFADVRVHVGPEAKSIGALAFTQGSNLHFAPGQYDPNAMKGQQLLGHELTHVVQQRAGRVCRLVDSEPVVVEDSILEREAEHNANLLGSNVRVDTAGIFCSKPTSQAHGDCFPSTTGLASMAIQRMKWQLISDLWYDENKNSGNPPSLPQLNPQTNQPWKDFEMYDDAANAPAVVANAGPASDAQLAAILTSLDDDGNVVGPFDGRRGNRNEVGPSKGAVYYNQQEKWCVSRDNAGHAGDDTWKLFKHTKKNGWKRVDTIDSNGKRMYRG